jgi:O-antigen/teichoic acid export membrane protein
MAWVGKTLGRSLKLALLASVPASLLLVTANREIFLLWVGNSVEPSFLLVLGFSLWMVLYPVGTALAMVLNAAQIVRFQVVTAIAMAVANLCLSVALTLVIGTAGVIWGTVLSYSAVTLVPTLLRALSLTSAGGRRSSAAAMAAVEV